MCDQRVEYQIYTILLFLVFNSAPFEEDTSSLSHTHSHFNQSLYTLQMGGKQISPSMLMIGITIIIIIIIIIDSTEGMAREGIIQVGGRTRRRNCSMPLP